MTLTAKQKAPDVQLDARNALIRPARVGDLDALMALEQRAFATDRLSRRSFRHLLTKGKSVTSVCERDGVLLGYVMLLLHSGTSLARMYSLAVDEGARGQGVGERLVRAAEAMAIDKGCISLRLEVRADNPAAIRLYRRLGYRQFEVIPDYYEDHAEALRFEKRLEPQLTADLRPVPFYRQTLDFTCGPAALMMAMKALDPKRELSRTLELYLWRHATTIFMTSGHGGCGPHGLALAAVEQGFDVELYLSEHDVMFIDSVRSVEKKEVMRLVQEDFVRELHKLSVPMHQAPIKLQAVEEALAAGAMALVLISSYRIYGEKFPHWVVITGFDERFVYVHDPYVDSERDKVDMDSVNMPIPRRDFERIARYGKSAQRAAIVLRRRKLA